MLSGRRPSAAMPSSYASAARMKLFLCKPWVQTRGNLWYSLRRFHSLNLSGRTGNVESCEARYRSRNFPQGDFTYYRKSSIYTPHCPIRNSTTKFKSTDHEYDRINHISKSHNCVPEHVRYPTLAEKFTLKASKKLSHAWYNRRRAVFQPI